MDVHYLTFLFEKDATFCDDYWYITIYVTLIVFVRERNGNICVFDADLQRNTKYADRSLYCIEKACQYISVKQPVKCNDKEA